MPLSSTNVTDNNNISSSAISELDSNQFTYFGNNNILSNSTPNTLSATSSQPPYRKQKLTATSTWQFAHNPLPHKATHDGRNQIWYCLICKWDSASLTSVQAHFSKKHGIEIQAGEVKAKQLQQECLINILNKLEGFKQLKCETEKEQILRAAINYKAFNKAFVQLIAVHNLLYNAATWPELHILFIMVNYTVEEVAINVVGIIPKLIKQLYLVHCNILK